jgi:integrase
LLQNGFEVAADALRQHLVTQAKERLKAGPKWVDSGMVFTSGIGTPLDPDNLYYRWNEVRQVLDEPLPRFHDLRHTCVSLLLAEGVPPHIV